MILHVVLFTALHPDPEVDQSPRVEREDDISRGLVGEDARIQLERCGADRIMFAD